MVLEMQGGGETSNTGKITNLLNSWAANPDRTNAMLRAETEASTLETMMKNTDLLLYLTARVK